MGRKAAKKKRGAAKNTVPKVAPLVDATVFGGSYSLQVPQGWMHPAEVLASGLDARPSEQFVSRRALSGPGFATLMVDVVPAHIRDLGGPSGKQRLMEFVRYHEEENDATFKAPVEVERHDSPFERVWLVEYKSVGKLEGRTSKTMAELLESPEADVILRLNNGDTENVCFPQIAASLRRVPGAPPPQPHYPGGSGLPVPQTIELDFDELEAVAKDSDVDVDFLWMVAQVICFSDAEMASMDAAMRERVDTLRGSAKIARYEHAALEIPAVRRRIEDVQGARAAAQKNQREEPQYVDGTIFDGAYALKVPLGWAHPPVHASARGWLAKRDDASGKEYYVHEATGESTWDRPADSVPSETFISRRAFSVALIVDVVPACIRDKGSPSGAQRLRDFLHLQEATPAEFPCIESPCAMLPPFVRGWIHRYSSEGELGMKQTDAVLIESPEADVILRLNTGHTEDVDFGMIIASLRRVTGAPLPRLVGPKRLGPSQAASEPADKRGTTKEDDLRARRIEVAVAVCKYIAKAVPPHEEIAENPRWVRSVQNLRDAIITDDSDEENFYEYMQSRKYDGPEKMLKGMTRWPRLRKYWPRLRRRICSYCGTRTFDLSTPRFLVCGGCAAGRGVGRYCSEACQRADWPEHQEACTLIHTMPVEGHPWMRKIPHTMLFAGVKEAKSAGLSPEGMSEADLADRMLSLTLQYAKKWKSEGKM